MFVERQLAIEKDEIQHRPKEYNVWPVREGGCDSGLVVDVIYKLKM